MIKLKKCIDVSNYYSGSNWNFEETRKYILVLDGLLYEAGRFRHFKGEEYKKTVIELPVSHGCIARCRFCASRSIQNLHYLTALQLQELFRYIYDREKLVNEDYVLITLTGIGDLYYNSREVKAFLGMLAGYRNLHVTLSSSLWTDDLLKYFEEMKDFVHYKHIQCTYITDKQEILKRIVPVYNERRSNFNNIIKYIEKSENTFYRINYLMIKGVNDSDSDFERFIHKINLVKRKVIIRIAKLNQTSATDCNSLKAVNIERMQELKRRLIAYGINAYLFYAVQNDNMNCGQLVTDNINNVEGVRKVE